MKFKLSNEGEIAQHSRSGIILNGYRHLTISEVMNLLNEQDREITKLKIDCDNLINDNVELMAKQNKIVRALQKRYNKAREANNKSIEGSLSDIVSYTEIFIIELISEKIGVKLNDGKNKVNFQR